MAYPPDSGSIPPSQRSGMDAFFGNTSMVLLILLAVCCEPVGLILGIIGLVTCKDPTAKNNALIVTIIGAVLSAVGSGGYFIHLGH